MWNVDLSIVDFMVEGVTRTRLSAGIRRHPFPPELKGRMPLPVALIQMAKTSGPVAATIAADAALREEKVTLDELRDAVNADSAAPRLRLWLDGLDAGAESVGESRLRLIFLCFGWSPDSQVEIQLGDGTARVDFLLGERVVVEFDGMVKDGGLQGREALAKEKAREEKLRALGFKVLRVVWCDLDNPAEIRRRVVAAGAQLAREAAS